MADRDDRRECIKDQYRVDGMSYQASDGGRSIMKGGGSRSLLSSSCHNPRRKIGNGLDAGPFNGFLNSTDDTSEKPARERRSSTIDGILNEAKNKKYEQKAQEVEIHNHYDDMLENGSAFDQERMNQKKEKGLQQIANLVITTAKLTRSAAKGSVNAVRDPKRAVKNFGHFTKDAAKGTVNMVRDPKKAAMNVTNLTTKTIKGTVKFGANVTNDVAKGGFEVTRAVAKGSLDATTMVVGRTTDGLGNVVNGATGLFGVKRGEKGQTIGQAEYHAKDLPCRRKAALTLMDRVIEVVDPSDEALIAAATKQPNTSRTTASASWLVPAAATPGRASMGSWDV
jgi:hypothetical protein